MQEVFESTGSTVEDTEFVLSEYVLPQLEPPCPVAVCGLAPPPKSLYRRLLGRRPKGEAVILNLRHTETGQARLVRAC